MKVCVFGLWHLGCVTAACLANAGHDVTGLDLDEELIGALRQGRAPLYEPGLDDALKAGIASGRLHFETNRAAAVAGADIVWVTFDTPVDDNDIPQVAAVYDSVLALAQDLPHNCLVLVSSQLPVGTTRQLATAANADGRHVTFAYSPENLRLGEAIRVFCRPDRVIVGLMSDADRAKIAELLAPFTNNIIWMNLEAAELTKHAINAFLATSVVFMNEIASLCERTGANAKDVEIGLKSEQRIGPKAYLSPGGAYAGGTLARDITTLIDIGHTQGLPMPLVFAVRESNDRHRAWGLQKLAERLGDLRGKRIAILGLTYKPGTSTLRRSSAVELARALIAHGAQVSAYDPEVKKLPADLSGQIDLFEEAALVAQNADAIVVATLWPEFRALDWSALIASMGAPIVVDPNWFLAEVLKDRPGVTYLAVGGS